MSLAAAAVLGLGLAVHWRSESSHAAETRTVGTALAVFGAMLMAGAVVLAWPSPMILIAVSLVTALAFVVLAVIGQVAVLHTCAAVAATLAYLLIVLRASVPLDDLHTHSRQLIDALPAG